MIKIFGDSFAANKDGWGYKLTTANFSSNGASEYRIYRSFLENYNSSDVVIFCHTHWSRVFLKDSVTLLKSRQLNTHPQCDLIISDLMGKNEKDFFNILLEIWDEDYLQTTYWLMVEKMFKVPNSLHITFFEDIKHERIYNFNCVWHSNKGNINHMNQYGNNYIYNILSNLIKQP